MLKFGVISEIDVAKGLARVYFEEDELVSGWLQISVMKSLNDQVFFPFDIKERVWAIMDEYCDEGVIGGALFDTGNKPSGAAAGKLVLKFGDNSTIIYDRNNSTLKFDIKGDVEVKAETVKVISPSIEMTATTEVNIVSPMTKVSGILSVAGIAAVGGLTGPIDAPSPAVPGNIEVAGEVKGASVKAGSVDLGTHRHTSTSGGGPTSTPIP
jgi:phage baseplate assembly protein V